MIMGLPTPVKDVPPFDTETGCRMAKHSIEIKVGPDMTKLLNMTCLKVGEAWGYAFVPASCIAKHEMAHAGGWGVNHPGAIKTKECGEFEMPPHSFPLRGIHPVIHRVPREDIPRYCGLGTVGCTIGVGDRNPVVYIPIR